MRQENPSNGNSPIERNSLLAIIGVAWRSLKPDENPGRLLLDAHKLMPELTLSEVHDRLLKGDF